MSTTASPVADVATLQLIDDVPLADGTHVWVTTLGRFFRLAKPSALTLVAYEVEQALTPANQWIMEWRRNEAQA